MTGRKISPREGEASLYAVAAVFILEMIIGGAALLYGIMRAAPETAGGPPVIRFPWLGWGVASLAAPVVFALLARAVAGLFAGPGDASGDDALIPEKVRRLYAIANRAPAIAGLACALGLAAALFFVDGAFRVAADLAASLAPHLPWIAASVCALLSVYVIVRGVLAYKGRKLEREYAWRREVLEKTGLVIGDRQSAVVSDPARALPPVETRALAATVIDAEHGDPANLDNNPQK